MMRHGLTARRLMAGLVVGGLMLMHAPAWAAGLEDVSPPVRKLSRGLANAVTGILEIPLSVRAVGTAEGPVAGMSVGLFMGLGAAVTRTAVGLIEIVTFPFPLPTSGYEPLLQPEFLFQPETAAVPSNEGDGLSRCG